MAHQRPVRKKQARPSIVAWIRGERGYAMVLLLAGAAIGMIPWGIDHLSAEAAKRTPAAGLRMYGDTISSLDYLLSWPDDEVNRLGGVADHMVIVNNSDHAVTVVALSYLLEGTQYPVRFATRQDCSGASFSLASGQSVEADTFVAAEGSSLLQAAIDGMVGSLVATTASGDQIPVVHESGSPPLSEPSPTDILYNVCSSAWPYG